MFLYGFVPLWFQIVVWFVALISLILPAALSQSPSVVGKLMMCSRGSLKPGLTEKFPFSFLFFFVVVQKDSAVYRHVFGSEGYS